MTTFDAGVLEAHVRAAVSRDKNGSRVFAFHLAASPSTLPAEVTIDDRKFSVRYARSELEFRHALWESEKHENRLVVLTPLSTRDLAADIRARLARRHLLGVDPWEAVKALFKADRVDASLRSSPALAESILELSHRCAIPASATGTVDGDLAWKTLLEAVLGVEDLESTTLADLLIPEANRRAADGLTGIEPTLREQARDQIVSQLGPGADLFLRHAFAGYHDLLPTAIAIGAALAAPGDDESRRTVDAFLVRLERHFDGELQLERGKLVDLSKSAEAAVRLLRKSKVEVDITALGAAAETVLNENKAGELSSFSRFTPSGWTERCRKMASAIERVLVDPAARGELEGALRQLEHHVTAWLSPRLLERMATAARLAFALGESEATPPADVTELARQYVMEWSWEDRAREAIAFGDVGSTLAKALSRLRDTAAKRTLTRNEAFARGLAALLASDTNPKGALPQARVLDRVVARLAESTSVLFVVMDGLSWAVARSLLCDETIKHLEVYAPAREGRLSPMFAVLPTITGYARTTLLTGQVQSGTQKDEARRFVRHPGLLRAVKRADGIQIFHRDQVSSDEKANLGRAVCEAIESETNRIVGLVLNTVDDQLLGSAQLDVIWRIDSIPPLRTLLELATSSGRLVVIASDHGHVWEASSRRVSAESMSSRHRVDDGEPQQGEVSISGRVVSQLTGRDSVIVPFDERIRYRGENRGYHGGITLQEVIAPIFVLSQEELDEGSLHLVRLPTEEPAWWRFDEEQAVAATVSKPRSEPKPKAQPPKEGQQVLALGAERVAKTEPVKLGGWISELLGKALFKNRVGSHLRNEGELTRMGTLLSAVDSAGGRAHVSTLSTALNQKASRVVSFIEVVKRVVNIDGYAILSHDRKESMVRFDRRLLEKQFGLSTSSEAVEE